MEEGHPSSKIKVILALDIACQNKARELRYKAPRTSHIVDGLLMSLDFYTEDTDRVGDTVKIFLLPDLSLTEISEATLVARRWDTALDSSILMTFTNTVALL